MRSAEARAGASSMKTYIKVRVTLHLRIRLGSPPLPSSTLFSTSKTKASTPRYRILTTQYIPKTYIRGARIARRYSRMIAMNGVCHVSLIIAKHIIIARKQRCGQSCRLRYCASCTARVNKRIDKKISNLYEVRSICTWVHGPV